MDVCTMVFTTSISRGHGLLFAGKRKLHEGTPEDRFRSTSAVVQAYLRQVNGMTLPL